MWVRDMGGWDIKSGQELGIWNHIIKPAVKQHGWLWGCLLMSNCGGVGNDLLLPQAAYL